MQTPANEADLRSARLDEVVKLLRGKVAADQQSTLDAFVRSYFGQVDPEDLDDRDLADLYGAAMSHWNFAHRREPGQLRVRAFNPTIAEHGWQSTHTIVEIVNDDMPFLVDSVTMEVNRHGLTLHLIIHPILAVRRAADGTLAGLAAEDDAAARRESFIHVEVDRVPEASRLEGLAADVARVLGDVRQAVTDWSSMRQRLQEIVADLDVNPPPIPAAELSEGRAFLQWLADNHFTLLGCRAHELGVEDGQDVLKVIQGSSLGILREVRDKDAHAKVVASGFAALPPELRAYARRPELLVVTKSTARSTVHRPGYLDYIAVKRFGADGQVCGEIRFLGLFTSTAYSANPVEIPLLRRKVADVVARAGLSAGSHAGKALVNILETYPRDELFQTSSDDLLRTAMGILHLGDRQRFRLFVRRDPFERFLSCLIYAPRENYTTELREKWQQILVKAFNGSSSEFNVHLSESVLARIQITVRTRPGYIPPFDVRVLEAGLVESARRWDDDLKRALVESLGEARGIELMRRFGDAFPASYRDEFLPRAAVPDIEMMARLSAAEPIAMMLYRPLEAAPGTLRFKLLRHGEPLTLSGSLPMLEHMGLKVLDEHPHRIAPFGATPIWMHDFGLQATATDTEIDVDALRPVFEEAFGAILRGEVENDDFNRLVVAARVPAGEIVLLRAYAKYMRQTGFALSQAFIESTLAAHAGIARSLVELFKARFDPAQGDGREARIAEQVQAIEAALEGVDNLSEDRVLRQTLALIQATNRTNYWRRDAAGQRRSFVSFKFDPSKVPGLPEPKPMFEIFVYSTRFEGVHLRGGRVARGGLRWSDRPEDFRTEVLGLVKAQMVKNTVIVPVGSKGGFVLKKAPPSTDREAFMKEGVACYQNYLRGLLDLTDNRVGDAIAPPPDVVRHDADDPYLVVAADKGTATFSDFANAVSKEYGFWLGDAFASGGSVGYDHKAMGITARGAWESVKRHFRELGVDTQATNFTVAGVGDMSGDVFGNGMLLSKHIRLVAAFDHRHIFLDPNADSATGFAERERLFALPRSSWDDYNKERIGKGGGVFARSLKEIPLSPDVKALIGSDSETLSPPELINALLKAQTDLLWFGGIGTYIKAASQTHADVGDRANDGVRANGGEVRARVVGEGANLGVTQLGRIEYAKSGGRIDTDAVDNSAGVDTSDHEVNLKILLSGPVMRGTLSEEKRNAFLASLTDEVAAHVLADNYNQTLALSVAQSRSHKDIDAHARLMHDLEMRGKLNRGVEFLPGDAELKALAQAGKGLTRPELAVLLAYAKLDLDAEVLASTLPGDPAFAALLAGYFPPEAVRTFPEEPQRHRLKREIISTVLINTIVNLAGPLFVLHTAEVTGLSGAAIARGFVLSDGAFGLSTLKSRIDTLDGKVDANVQTQLYSAIADQFRRATRWFLTHVAQDARIADASVLYHTGVETLRHSHALTDGDAARIAELTVRGVPEDIARDVTLLPTLTSALDVALLAHDVALEPAKVAAIYFEVGDMLGLDHLRMLAAKFSPPDHWDRLALRRLLDDLYAAQRRIAHKLLSGGSSAESWAKIHGDALTRMRGFLADLDASGELSVAKLMLASSQIQNLV